MFDKGDRVMTPGGVGSVISRRMGGPNYSEVVSYSVCLDTKKAASEKPPFPYYNGTTYPAEHVKEHKDG